MYINGAFVASALNWADPNVVFVKKGMQISFEKCSTGTGYSAAAFFPFIE